MKQTPGTGTEDRNGKSPGSPDPTDTTILPGEKAARLLEARGLCLDFGGVKGLDKVDLDLGPGECLAVIGPNGAGKTTLFNVLSGFLAPRAGKVCMEGRDLAGMDAAARARHGLVRTFQNGRVFPALSARENLLLGAHHLRTSGRKGFILLAMELIEALLPWRGRKMEGRLKTHVESVAAFFGDRILPFLDRGAWTFSYANRRRLELGRALAANPRVLLLDEPSAGMNPRESLDLMEFLASLKSRGQAMLIIEHKLPLVMELADRVMVMDEGRVIACGTPAMVARDPGVIEAYIGQARNPPATRESRAEPPHAEAGTPHTMAETPQAKAEAPHAKAETPPAIIAEPGAASGIPGPASPLPLLRLQGIFAGYGGMEVLHGLDLMVEKAEIVCLLGGNASGKSTTMKTILGLVEPRQGEIFWEGQSLRGVDTPARVALGMASVPEARRIFPDLTVRENILLGAWVHRKDRKGKKLNDDVQEVLQIFPRLADRLGQQGGSLSGGEQQMLAMARALMSRPRLILMDEPTMGLAPVWVDGILDLILRLNSRGTAILMVEQNAHQALEIAHRAYVLQNGCLVMEGPARQIAGDEGIKRAYLGGLA